MTPIQTDRQNMLKAFGFGGGGGASKGASGMMQNIGAGVGAAIGLGTFGMDIYNTVMNQRAAKEQLDLTKKNWNLELEKAQKQEYANNKLAASVDKAWGGDGKIENTIDYSQYKATDSGNFMDGKGKDLKDLGGGSLKAGGLGGDYIKDTTQNVASNELGGSGNMPIMNASSNMLQPVGYSETLNTQDSSADTSDDETSQ